MTRSLLAAVLLLATFDPSSADAHGRDEGRLLWSRFTDTTFATARIVDGDRVLSHGAPGEQDLDAAPSPGGNRILFERDTDDGGAAIVLMNADGSRQRVLDLGCADPCVLDLAPGWTPDGGRITFTRVIGPFDGPNDGARSVVLWSAKPDGSDLRRLSQPGIDGVYEDYRARFLPDGRTVTFVRIRSADIKSAIFAMDVRTKRVRRLTPWELDADTHDVSRQGVVAFETFGHGLPEGESSNIATVPVDCGSPAACSRKIRFVTHNGAGPTWSINPAWTPDGRRVTFGEFSDTAPGDLWTARPDGSDRRQITDTPEFDFRPAWSPR
jgi:Tol biopolymer transport system component